MILTLKQILDNKDIFNKLRKKLNIFYYNDSFNNYKKIVVIFKKTSDDLNPINIDIRDLKPSDAEEYLFLITNNKNPVKWNNQKYSLFGFSIVEPKKKESIKDDKKIKNMINQFLKNIEDMGFKIENKETLLNDLFNKLKNSLEKKGKKYKDTIKSLTFEIINENKVLKPCDLVKKEELEKLYFKKNFETIKKNTKCIICDQEKDVFIEKINNLFSFFTLTSGNNLVSQIPLRFGKSRDEVEENLTTNICKDCGLKILKLKYLIDFAGEDPYFKVEENINVKIFPYYLDNSLLKSKDNKNLFLRILKDFYDYSNRELTFEGLVRLINKVLSDYEKSETFNLLNFEKIKNNLCFDIVFYIKDGNERKIVSWINNIELAKLIDLNEKLEKEFKFVKDYKTFKDIFVYKKPKDKKKEEKKQKKSKMKLIRNLYFKVLNDLLNKEIVHKRILNYLMSFYWKKYKNYIKDYKNKEEKSFKNIEVLFLKMSNNEDIYKLAEEIGRLTYKVSLEKVKKLSNKKVEEFSKEDWDKVYKQPYIKKVFFNSKFRTVKDLLKVFEYLVEKAIYLKMPISREKLRELTSNLKISENQKIDETFIKFYIIKGFYGK